MKLYCLLAVPFLVSTGNAFSTGILQKNRSTKNARNSASNVSVRQFLVDPFMFSLGELPMDAGIAALSAAAGALSQQSKVKELGRELETTRAALTVSEQQLVDQIHELEEKLFVMDREFEGQTDKFKKQYDLKMRDDLERVTEKMKIDFRYKLDIRVEEQKSKMLQDKLSDTSYVTGDRQTELVELRLKQSRAMIANQKMEKALEESTLELKTMREAASKKSSWWKR
jgi:phage-related minor tail protein